MSNRYDWNNGPPVLENHSRCKHEIIRDYLVRYMCVLARGSLRFPNKKFNLTIVDGFAGGGQYSYKNKIVDGSPLVILKAAEEATIHINSERETRVRDSLNMNVDFFFVEKERKSADFLRDTIKNEGYSDGRTHVLHGAFGTHLPKIINFIKAKSHGKAGRAIFILDQYGYSQVLFDQLRQIMTSLKSEVILTFAVDSLVAYLSEKGKSTLKGTGFTDADIAQIHRQDNPDKCRGMIQQVLSKHILDMGFSFTPFCIYGDKSHWGYWLVHLSSHYRARDEMMNVHWDKGNTLVHYGGAGMDMFGYRSKSDENYTEQSLLGDEFRFDSHANERVLKDLRQELPEFIYQKGEIRHCDLLKEVFNHTPANREKINKVLWEGVESKELSVPRRDVRNIKDSDVIKFAPQRIMKFLN